MRKATLLILLSLMISLIGFRSDAQAFVTMYLDTAPNAYGSPAWIPFRDGAYQKLYDETFVHQQHSTNPANRGTINYEALDYLVYSFGDLGKRLHVFYYIPGQTVDSLRGRLHASILYQEDGVWKDAYAEAGWGTWVAPSSLINYDGNNDGRIDGVMGTIGMAMWGAYGHYVDTPEARQALANDLNWVRAHIGNTQFRLRLDSAQICSIEAVHVPIPIPSSLILIGSGLVGLIGMKKRFKN